MAGVADDIEVKYTVKELLYRMEDAQAKGFAVIQTLLASKADKSDITRLEARLDHEVERIDSLESARGVAVAVRQDRWSRRERFTAIAGVVALCAATIIAGFATRGGW